MLRQSDIVVLKNEYKGFLTLLGNEEVISIIFSPSGARDAKQLYKKNYKKGYVYPFDYDWSIDKIYRPVDADSLGEWIAGTKSLDDENEFALVWDREKAPPMPVPLPSVGVADVGKVLMVDQEGEWSTSADRQDAFTIHWTGPNTIEESPEEIYAAIKTNREIKIDWTEHEGNAFNTKLPLMQISYYSLSREYILTAHAVRVAIDESDLIEHDYLTIRLELNAEGEIASFGAGIESYIEYTNT